MTPKSAVPTRPRRVRTRTVVSFVSLLTIALATLWLRSRPGTSAVEPAPPGPLAERPTRPPSELAAPMNARTAPPATTAATPSVVRVAVELRDGSVRLEAGTVALSGRFPSTWTESAVEGTNGAFLVTVDDLLDRRLVLTCRAPGHFARTVSLAALAAQWTGRRAEEVVRIELEKAPTGAIRARVVDATTRAPVTGAEVFVVDRSGGGRGPRVLATSDAVGVVVVDSSDVRGRMFVRRGGYLPAELSASEPPQDLGDVPMHAGAEPPSLVVRVAPRADRGTHVRVARVGPDPSSAEFATWSDGVPAAAYDVATRILGPALSGTGSEQRWANGPPLTCTAMLPGRYVVTARNPDLGVATRVVEVRLGASEVDLELRQGPTVRFTGESAGTIRWTLDALEWTSGTVIGTSDRVTNLLPGEYRLSASGIERTVRVPPVGELTIDLGTASLHSVRGVVQIKDAQGRNSPGAGLRLRIPGTSAVATTDAKGRFLIPGLTPGSYRLLVEDHAPAIDAGDTIEIATSARADLDIGSVVVLARGLDSDPDAPK